MDRDYYAVSAKLKAMYSYHLTKDDYISISKKKTISEIISYLKNSTGYGNILSGIDGRTVHREDLEIILREYMFLEYDRMYRFVHGDKRKLLWFLCMREEIWYIKRMFRKLYNRDSDVEPIEVSDFVKNHSSVDISALVNAESVDSLIGVLKNSQYSKLLVKYNFDTNSFNLFDAEMSLDKYYLTSLNTAAKKYLPKSEYKILSQIIGTEADLTNISWIYRAKKYFNIPKEIIYSYIVPVYNKINHDDIVSMVELDSSDDIIRYLEKGPYSVVFENKDDRFIEEKANKFLYRLCKRIYISHARTIAEIFAYFVLKEQEFKNIIIIAESIRYGFDEDIIVEHITV